MNQPDLEAEVAGELAKAFRRQLRKAKKATMSGQGVTFSPLLTFQDLTALAVREIQSMFLTE